MTSSYTCHVLIVRYIEKYVYSTIHCIFICAFLIVTHIT